MIEYLLYRLRCFVNSMTGRGYKNHLCNPIYRDHYEHDVANLSQRHRRQYDRSRQVNR